MLSDSRIYSNRTGTIIIVPPSVGIQVVPKLLHLFTVVPICTTNIEVQAVHFYVNPSRHFRNKKRIFIIISGYLGEFTISGLILFVTDSGATPRGHHVARIIAAWC